MGCPHPGLECAERVLDCAPPDAHLVGVALHSIIHLIDQMLVLQAGDAALLAGRTSGLYRTMLTIILPLTPVHQASLFSRIAVGQLLFGGAGVAINRGVVDNVCLRWQRGESMSSVGRHFNRASSSIFPHLAQFGGIRPPDRKRS